MDRYAVVRFLDDECSPTWAAFYPRYIAHAKTYKSKITMATSEPHAIADFTRFIGDSKLNEITPERADAWHIDMAGRLRRNTIRTRLSILREVFEYAVDIDVIGKNPFRHVKPPRYERAGRVLTDLELAALLSALPALPRRAVMFALYTGVRKQELLSVEWSWVRESYLVIPANRAKSGKERSIPLHPRARKTMGTPTTGPIFPLSYDQLRKSLLRAAKIAKIGRIRLHDFRHTWATRYMEMTRDIFSLMAAGGWASTLSAEPYQHVDVSRLRPMLKLTYRGLEGL